MGTITYLDGSHVDLALEHATPPQGAPELALIASLTFDQCEFHLANGDVYTGEFAHLDTLDQADASQKAIADQKAPADASQKAAAHSPPSTIVSAAGGTDGGTEDGGDDDPPAAVHMSIRYAPHGEGQLVSADGDTRIGTFVRGEHPRLASPFAPP
jgi:hypothetical protein